MLNNSKIKLEKDTKQIWENSLSTFYLRLLTNKQKNEKETTKKTLTIVYKFDI